MDLSSIKEANTAEYELLHPVDRSRLGAFFTLAGPEHHIRRGLSTRWARELRQRVNRTGKVTLDDPDVERDRDTDFLVGCTLGWSGVSLGGAELPYNAANARKLYDDSEYAWVRRQIQEALNQQELFIRSSSGA